MPRYRATLSDGRVVEFTAETQPTEAEILAALEPAAATPPLAAPAPTTAATPAPPPPMAAATAAVPGAEIPAPDELVSHPSLLSRTLGVINTIPKQLQQGAANVIDVAQGQIGLGEAGRRQLAALSPDSPVSGETVLQALEMNPGLARTVLGLGIDLATPLGLGATRAAKLVSNPIAREILANPVTAALKGTGRAALAVPGVAKGVEELQKPFVQFAGLEKFAGPGGLTAQEALRLQASAQAAARNVGVQQAVHAFKDVADAGDRWAIANYLSDPAKYPLRPELQSAAENIRQLLSEHADALEAAGLLDPAKRLTNYFPQVRTMDEAERAFVANATKGIDKFTKQRVLSWEEHLKTGKAVDPIEALATRLGSGHQALQTSEFLDTVAKDFGRAVGTEGTRPLNLRNLTLTEPQKEALTQVAFPHEIASALERGNVIFNDPEGWKKMIVGINRGFKTAVTTFNPAHHANNIQGNAYMMYLAGMSLKDIAKAYIGRGGKEVAQLLSAKAPEELPFASEKLGKGSSVETLGEAFHYANKYNLFGSSESALELQRAVGPKTGLVRSAADAIRLQSSRYIEDPAKWALFKDQLRKGVSPEQAALHVKKFMFDYSELTDFERGLRDYGVVPFYAWMRKNIPLHLDMLTTAPARLRKAQLIYAAPGRVLGQPENIIAQPAWLSEEGYQPVDRFVDSPAANQLLGPRPTDGTPMLRFANPALDINRLSSPGAFLKANLGPFPRMVAEMATQRDLRSGQQLFGTPTGYVAASPLGTLATAVEMKTGLPMPRFGTEPTIRQGKVTTIQPELAAYLMNQIPLPLVQYAQQIAGAPGETMGSQLETPKGRLFLNLGLRALGLTPRDLTTEQQIQTFKTLVNSAATRELKQEEIQQLGEALRRP